MKNYCSFLERLNLLTWIALYATFLKKISKIITRKKRIKLMRPGKRFLRGRYYEPILICLLLAWGTAICLFYGRIGFMPLDQSIVFDGGWRIISGQIPFRDFNTPNAIVPILLQAAFFKLFGINWFAYCLHAAVFNGLFCLLIFFLLESLGAARLISFFYAFLSGLIFYPPFGVPYTDQHSFFFVTLAIVIAYSQAEVITSPQKFWPGFFFP